MDYTMDTLSMGDVRVCDEKCTVEESSYGVSVDHHVRFIHENQDHKGNQHEVDLLGTTSSLRMPYSDTRELSVAEKDSVLQEAYGIESNMIAEDVYQMREDSTAHFVRSCVYGEENKITRNTDEVLKQCASDRQSSFYYNEDRLAQENICADQVDCLGRSSLNSVNDVRPLGTIGLEKVDKMVTSGDRSYESVVSDFMPSTPQSKDHQCLDIPLERNIPYNETLQDKHFQYQQENSSGYVQIMPQQQSPFVEMNFQRADHFMHTKEARNILYQDNCSMQEESYSSNTDMVDVSERVNMAEGSRSCSNVHDNVNSLSLPVDNNFSERMESARAVAELTSLQDEETVRALEAEHSRVQELKQSGALQSYADLAHQISGYQNESDQVYLSKSNDLMELGLHINNADTARANQDRHELKGGQEYSNLIEDNIKTKTSKIFEKSVTDEELTHFRQIGEDHNSYKTSFIRGKSINNESKSDKEMSEHIDTAETDDDEEASAKSTGGSSAGNKKSSVREEDVASVQSIESPPSPEIGARRKFKCKLCNKLWKLRKDLNKHMKTHTEKKKYICSICNSSFINKTILKKHLLTHCDVKDYSCAECPTTFSSLDDLKYHQHIHKVRIFSCSDCSYTTKRQKHLNKHMLVHTTAKAYNCQLCKFSSKRKYSLQRHMKTAHSTAKILECTVCNFKSSAVDNFKLHVAMHVSSRTTSCIVCHTVIKKRPKLIKHLISHCNDEDNTCKDCNEIFTTGHTYMLHLLSHKDSSSSGHEEVNQASISDISTSSLLNGSMDATSGTFGFLARKNKIIMDTPTMEVKLSQMSTVASRLADMTKVVTLLNEKTKVVFQLTEISTLARELAVISGSVLESYKNTYGVTDGSVRSRTKTSSISNDGTEDSSFANDVFEMSSIIDIHTGKIKEEFQDCIYPSTEAGMQIQVDFNGDPVSCVQKDDPEPFGSETSLKSKGDKHLKCTRCNLTFTDTRSLKRHLMAHDDVRPYSCDKCGQSFRRNEHLKKHMVTHSDERPFICKECPYAAKTEHRLKIHLLCHSQTKAFACQHCTYTARTNYELNHHMKRHEPRTCSQCSFVCYSRAELKKHVFTHSSFDCNECEFTTSDRAEYTKHVKRHSLVQHLCCELCGYSCDTMKKFKYHKLRHDNKTPYECPDCDYRCSSRASFDCHRLKHAGLKPFLCSFCGAAFRKTSHLNQHLLIHKDEKAFKCEECGYSCRTKHNLKEHEMTHSGEKPFACRYCSFSCRRNKALQLHILKHENPTMMIPPLHMPTMKHENQAMMIPPLHMPTMQFSHHLQMPHQMSMIPSGP